MWQIYVHFCRSEVNCSSRVASYFNWFFYNLSDHRNTVINYAYHCHTNAYLTTAWIPTRDETTSLNRQAFYAWASLNGLWHVLSLQTLHKRTSENGFICHIMNLLLYVAILLTSKVEIKNNWNFKKVNVYTMAFHVTCFC